MRFLNSEKIINGNIKIKINNEINNYSSFKLVFNKKQRIDIPINQTTNDEKDIIYYFKKILSIKIKDYFKYLKYLILQIFSKGESNMNVISIDFTN